MPRNIEIKAKLADFRKTLQLATELCESEAEVL